MKELRDLKHLTIPRVLCRDRLRAVVVKGMRTFLGGEVGTLEQPLHHHRRPLGIGLL